MSSKTKAKHIAKNNYIYANAQCHCNLNYCYYTHEIFDKCKIMHFFNHNYLKARLNCTFPSFFRYVAISHAKYLSSEKREVVDSAWPELVGI